MGFTETPENTAGSSQECSAALLNHLLERIREREISPEQLGLLAEWLDLNPEVPAGKWFKRLPGMTVCGEGELVKTFLRTEQAPIGQQVN